MRQSLAASPCTQHVLRDIGSLVQAHDNASKEGIEDTATHSLASHLSGQFLTLSFHSTQSASEAHAGRKSLRDILRICYWVAAFSIGW